MSFEIVFCMFACTFDMCIELLLTYLLTFHIHCYILQRANIQCQVKIFYRHLCCELQEFI